MIRKTKITWSRDTPFPFNSAQSFPRTKASWTRWNIQKMMPQAGAVVVGGGVAWRWGAHPRAAESVPALPTAQSTSEPPAFKCVGCWVCIWPTARAMQTSVTPHWRVYSSEVRPKWANLSIFCDGCPGSWQRTGSLHLASSTDLAQSRHPDI